jgi:hypothetical protein
MAKKNSTISDKKQLSFSDLNMALSAISPDGAILDESIYAKIDEWIPTGNYILNAALSGSLFGGMPNRRSLTFAGEEGCLQKDEEVEIYTLKSIESHHDTIIS